MEPPVNYAYLSGALQGQLSMIDYELYRRGIITADQMEAVRQVCQEAREKADKSTLEYANGG